MVSSQIQIAYLPLCANLWDFKRFVFARFSRASGFAVGVGRFCHWFFGVFGLWAKNQPQWFVIKLWDILFPFSRKTRRDIRHRAQSGRGY